MVIHNHFWMMKKNKEREATLPRIGRLSRWIGVYLVFE